MFDLAALVRDTDVLKEEKKNCKNMFFLIKQKTFALHLLNKIGVGNSLCYRVITELPPLLINESNAFFNALFKS